MNTKALLERSLTIYIGDESVVGQMIGQGSVKSGAFDIEFKVGADILLQCDVA